MEYIPQKLLVVSGGGTYPKMLIDGARRAGVRRIELIAVRGSTERAAAAAEQAGVPIVNYGVAIALMHGIVAHPGTCMVER